MSYIGQLQYIGQRNATRNGPRRRRGTDVNELNNDQIVSHLSLSALHEHIVSSVSSCASTSVADAHVQLASPDAWIVIRGKETCTQAVCIYSLRYRGVNGATNIPEAAPFSQKGCT